MGRPVIAYHIIFGAYGFWLPNDPRGSQSRYVFAPRLTLFGPPRPLKADTTLSPSDAEQLRAMQFELVRPPVRFDLSQIAAIADGFGEIIGKLELVFYAGAIMPDHVHIVAARQEMYAEDIAGHLKRAGSRWLRKVGLHPFESRRVAAPVNPGGHAGNSDSHAGNSGGHPGKQAPSRLPTPWGEHGWKVFLFDLDEIEHAIQYVNANPVEAGLAPQHWPWVKPYDG
jgi:REP element-mobilizing transposase RayT